MASEKLQVILELVTGNYKREAREAATATGQIGKSAQAVTGPLGGLTGTIGKLGGVMAGVFAGTQIVGFAKDSIMAASDLEESINAVDVVFGEAGEAIHEFGETSVDSVGLAAVNVNKSATVLGSALINVGLSADEAAAKTIELTTRASDMASVFNTTVPDALGAIQAALRGETDPIEKFGVSLSAAAVEAEAAALGYNKVAGEFEPAAKAAARMSLILQQTERVAGDFEDTADSTANTMKRLNERFTETKARVGQALMPAFTALLGVVEDLAPAVEDFALQIGELVGEMQPLIDGLGHLTSGWFDLRGEIRESADSSEAFHRIFGGIADIFTRSGLETLTELFRAFEPEVRSSGTATRDLGDAVRVTSDAYAYMIAAAQDSVDPIDRATRGLVDAKIAALAAGTAFRDELADDFLAAALSIEKGSTDIGVSLDKLEARLLENITEQAAFFDNLIILADEGYGDLAEFLENEGSDKVAGAAADLVEDLERASSLEAMIDKTERDAQRYTDALAAALESDKTRLLDIAQSVGVDLAAQVEAGFSTLELQDLLGIALGAPGLGPVQTGSSGTPTRAPTSTPTVGKFHSGGIVPGPLGSEQMILARAGEMVVPYGQQMGSRTSTNSTTININHPNTILLETDLQKAPIYASLVNLIEAF